MTQDTGLIVREQDLGLSFVKTPQQALDQLHEFQAFVSSVMVKGEDYGVIPGTPKPTLLKPGAEKVCEIYGLAPEVEVTNRIEDWENGFFHYEIRCSLISKRSGQVVAQGVGSCNSKEARYRWRDRKPECDACGMELRRSRNAEEWYCWKAKGGCGMTYPLDQIKVGGKVENDDPYTLVNTILKMAKKRALVDAALSATRSSGIFTQDVEDFHGATFEGSAHPVDATPPPAAAKAAAQTKAEWGGFWLRARDLNLSREQVHQLFGVALADKALLLYAEARSVQNKRTLQAVVDEMREELQPIE